MSPSFVLLLVTYVAIAMSKITNRVILIAVFNQVIGSKANTYFRIPVSVNQGAFPLFFFFRV